VTGGVAAVDEELIWRDASRFVAGRTFDEAAVTIAALANRGFMLSVHVFGVPATTRAAATAATDAFVELAHAVRGPAPEAWLAVDLSRIGLGVSIPFCRRQLTRITAALGPRQRVQVGAELASQAEATYRVVLDSADPAVMATVQANLRNAPAYTDRLVQACVPIRLVKGAFMEPERDAWPPGPATDAAFAGLARQIHAAGGELALATHDDRLRERLLRELGPLSCEQSFGVRPDGAEALLAAGLPIRICATYGDNWLGFYLRLLAEGLRPGAGR